MSTNVFVEKHWVEKAPYLELWLKKQATLCEKGSIRYLWTAKAQISISVLQV